MSLNNKTFPVLKEGYKLHKGPKYGYVYPFTFGSNDTGHVINEDAARILDKCDGKTSLEQIARKLAFHYKEDYKSTLKTIKSYLDASRSFVDILDKPKSIDFQTTGNWEIPTPTHASIELTYKCNFSCRHCYINSGPENDEFWKKNKLFEILNGLKRLGVLIIELTGGEPLMHPDFLSIMEHCLKQFPLVGVNTNGYLLNQDHITLFSKYKNRLSFQVDLNGDNPKYVDWFCGQKGAFENAKKAIEMLSKKEFVIRAAMTLTPMNVDQIFFTVDLAKKLGATSMILSTVVPMGRGKSSELIFSPEDMDQLIEQVEITKKEFGDFLFENPEYLPIIGEEKMENKLNCGAASRTVCLTPNGEVKMCPMSNPNDLSLGNVYYEDLDTIFSRNLSSLLIELEDPRPEICGECEHLWFCQRCLARGLQKYHEIGEKCSWGRNPELISILEGAKKVGRSSHRSE